MIKPYKGGYAVYNHTGKRRLSKKYKTKEGAQKRLKQIEHFKKNHKKK